jgi:hypothetical protein
MRFLARFQIEGRLYRISNNLFESDEVFETLEGRLDRLYIAYASFFHALTSFHAIACLSGTANIDRDLMQKYNYHENVSRSGRHCDKV